MTIPEMLSQCPICGLKMEQSRSGIGGTGIT